MTSKLEMHVSRVRNNAVFFESDSSFNEKWAAAQIASLKSFPEFPKKIIFETLKHL